jgi:hypothetical protein
LAEEAAQAMSRLGAKVIRNEEGAVRSVVLTDLPVSDAALEPLKQLGDLEVLSLSGTRVTNSGMPHLTGIERLTYLFMNDTDVTDQGLLALADSVALRYISLDRTSVTSGAVEEFHRLSPGTVVQHSPRREDPEGLLPASNRPNWKNDEDLKQSSPGEGLLTERSMGANDAGSARASFGETDEASDSPPSSAGVRLRYRKEYLPGSTGIGK